MVDISEAKIPVPEKIAREYLLWLIATSADRKLTGLLHSLLTENRLFFAFNVEKSGIFVEPDNDPDVQGVAWYKAILLQYLLQFFSKDRLLEAGVPLIDGKEHSVEIKNVEKKPEKAISMAMDSSTIVARNREDLDNPSKVIVFHKLDRKLRNLLNQEDRDEAIRNDKAEHHDLFANEHWVRFQVGVAAVSSDKTISNSVGVEFTVKVNGYSDEIIDAEYENPRMPFIGPRLNEAQLIEDHPECIELVEMTTISKNKKRKKIVLDPGQYYLVRQAVVHGVLPENMYKNLFTERKGIFGLHKTRPII